MPRMSQGRKTRKLRREVEWLLIVVTTLLIIFGACIDDMDISFVPVYLLIWLVVVVNIMIIRKYGGGVIYENKE